MESRGLYVIPYVFCWRMEGSSIPGPDQGQPSELFGAWKCIFGPVKGFVMDLNVPEGELIGLFGARRRTLHVRKGSCELRRDPAAFTSLPFGAGMW